MPAATAYMLDTNVCIAALRRDREVQRIPPPPQCVLSQITVAELWTGIEKSERRDEQEARLEQFLGTFTQLDFDESAARSYGEIRAALEKRGRTIGPLDLLIAAHARSVGATMLTGNFDEFSRVPGLKVLRWRKAKRG
ncbi:MAG: type II toxin-antitoxin system VapC family toxin [Chthoniobacteraceae bacterium]